MDVFKDRMCNVVEYPDHSVDKPDKCSSVNSKDRGIIMVILVGVM